MISFLYNRCILVEIRWKEKCLRHYFFFFNWLSIRLLYYTEIYTTTMTAGHYTDIYNQIYTWDLFYEVHVHPNIPHGGVIFTIKYIHETYSMKYMPIQIPLTKEGYLQLDIYMRLILWSTCPSKYLSRRRDVSTPLTFQKGERRYKKSLHNYI